MRTSQRLRGSNCELTHHHIHPPFPSPVVCSLFIPYFRFRSRRPWGAAKTAGQDKSRWPLCRARPTNTELAPSTANSTWQRESKMHQCYHKKMKRNTKMNKQKLKSHKQWYVRAKSEKAGQIEMWHLRKHKWENISVLPEKTRIYIYNKSWSPGTHSQRA